MGGHAAGEVASKITVETIAESLKAPIRSGRSVAASAKRPGSAKAIRSAKRTRARGGDAGRDAHGDGYDRSSFSGSAAGVHTSLTSAIAESTVTGRAAWCKLTKDQLVASEDGSMRNVLTRAIGAEDGSRSITACSTSPPATSFCSVRTVPRDPWTTTTSSVRCMTSKGEEASQRLIALAKENGAPDNVTVVLAYC